MVKEQGIEPGEKAFLIFANYINAQGWDAWLKHPCDYCVHLVWEFYANATEHKRKKAQVQGKRIDFSPEAINTFIGLEAPNICQYRELTENPNYEEIMAALTSGRGVWN